MRKRFFTLRVGGEALQEVAQRSCWWPIPETAQGQVEWGLEQRGQVKSIPDHGREGLNKMIFKVSSKSKHFMVLWLLKDGNNVNLLRTVVLPWEFRERQYKNASLRTIGSHGSCFVREQGRSNLKTVKSSVSLLPIHMHKTLYKGIHFCLFCVVSSSSELSRTESKSGYLVSDFMISF